MVEALAVLVVRAVLDDVVRDVVLWLPLDWVVELWEAGDPCAADDPAGISTVCPA